MRSQRRGSTSLRAIAVTIVVATVAASCGGDDDDADANTESIASEEAIAEGAELRESASDSGAAASDDNTDDGSPVIATLPPDENIDPVFGGTLRYGIEADSDGLNPTSSRFSVNGLMMGNAVFDNLAAITPDGGWVPYLAESFTPSADFTTWTMKLREGVLFHDGTPLDADAVIANFEAARAHPIVGLSIAPFHPAEGAIEKLDELTVAYHLLDPNVAFPAGLTVQTGMIASPAWLAAAAADPALNQAPVGTGPFMYESRSTDSVTRFVRNDAWWGGDVYLDAVEFYPITDSATRVDMLVGGTIDAIHTTDQQSILRLRQSDVQSVLDDSGEESFAMMNSAQPPFDDLRARQALAYATPRTAYNDEIGLGVNRAASQRFFPESPYYNPDVQQVGDDPDRAVELAAAYCAERGGEVNPLLGIPVCTDGRINIEVQYSGPSAEQTRIANLLATGWGAAFNVTLDELLQSEHVTQAAFGQFNVATWRQFGYEDPSADNIWVLCRVIGDAISLNFARSCDEERDSLLLQAQATADPAARASLYQQAEARINEAFVYVFFNHTMWANSFAPAVHGVCDRAAPDGTRLKCASNGRTWFNSVWIDPA